MREKERERERERERVKKEMDSSGRMESYNEKYVNKEEKR